MKLTRVGVVFALVALSTTRGLAGPGLSFELEPTTDRSFEMEPVNSDLTLAFGAAFQDPTPPEEPAPPSDKQWHLHLIPAFWIPAVFKGTVYVGPVQTEIDLDMGELLDALKFTIEGGFTVTNDDWSFQFYASYFNLGADAQSEGPLGSEQTSLNYKLTIVDFAVGKRIGGGPIGTSAWKSDLIGGVRYWHQKVAINQTGVGITPTINRSAGWFDAFVGGRIVFDVNDDLAIWLRGDVGGFGIGASSDLTWTLTAMLEWDLSNTWSLVAGYRYVDVDWTSSIGAARFEFDYKIHGPLIGALIRF